MIPDKIQDRANRLAPTEAEAATKLLQEQGWAVRRAQEQQCIHIRQVDTLIEEVDGEKRVDLSFGKISKSLLSLDSRRIRPNRSRLHAISSKDPRHETRVLDTRAKAKSAHAAWRLDVALHRVENQPCPSIVRREQLGQSLNVVSTAADKRYVAQVQSIGNSVVDKWA